jgi:hypothetical protein
MPSSRYRRSASQCATWGGRSSSPESDILVRVRCRRALRGGDFRRAAEGCAQGKGGRPDGVVTRCWVREGVWRLGALRSQALDRVAQQCAKYWAMHVQPSNRRRRQADPPIASISFMFERVCTDYAELSDMWKQIDAKAQATATTSGIFIAAAFAFIRNASFVLTPDERLLLAPALICLLVAICLAVVAMRVRSVLMPPEPEQIREMVEDLRACPPKEHAARHTALLIDTADAWTPVNKQLRVAIDDKANCLHWAQIFLLIAAAITFCLTFWVLFQEPPK